MHMRFSNFSESVATVPMGAALSGRVDGIAVSEGYEGVQVRSLMLVYLESIRLFACIAEC